MIEIEQRFKITKSEEILFKQKIQNLGGKKKFSGEVEDFIFTDINESYYVRIRIMKKKSRLEVKIPYRNNYKELETDISDPLSVIKMLKLFGLSPHLWIRRKREVYEIKIDNKNVEISFDNIQHIGRFIEISYFSKSHNKKFIEKIKRVLGIKKESKEPYGAIIRKLLLTNGKFSLIYKKEMLKRFREIKKELQNSFTK